MRLDWECYALSLARVASLRSEDPFVKVGACVLRYDNSVASLGYNGAPPKVNIDWYVTKLTGITNSMVKDAPTFMDVAHEIHQLISDKIFVAHDVNFDYKILKSELKRTGLVIQQPKLCTIEMSRTVFPEQPSYSLGKLCKELGLSLIHI